MFAEDYRAFYSNFGVEAIYEDRFGEETPCTVIVERDLSRFGEAGQVNARTAVVAVPRALVPDAPRRGERFVLSEDEVLTVDSLQRTDELEHRVFAA
jgi:hypothetical protein